MTGPNWNRRSGALLRTLAATWLAAAMLVSVTAGRASAQQTGLVDDTTYVFALDGMVVEWGGNWSFDPASSGQDVGVEVASLLSPLAGLLIGELAGGMPLDLDQFLALVLDSIAEDADEFVTVERSATDIVSYSLDAAVIEGIPAGLFTYIQPNTVTGTFIFTSILAEATTFASSVADAQANVTINGRTALEGIDGAALQNLLPEISASPANDDRDDADRQANGDGGRESSDDEGQQASDDDQESAGDPNDAGGEEVDSDPPAFDNGDEGSEDGDGDRTRSRLNGHEFRPTSGNEDDGGDEPAGLGLIDDGLYESPQFGIEIEWSAAWTPNPDLLSSNEDTEVDNLGLNNAGGSLVLVTILAADGTAPEDFAAYWQSEAFLDENASPEAEILLADSTAGESAVLIADVLEDGGEFWSLRQAYSLDGGDTIAIVLLLSIADDFPDNLEEAQDGISVDGDPVLSFFTLDEIEDAA